MGDFITFECPSCGGTLKNESGTNSYLCEFCGKKHTLRKEDIEFFAKCPKCKRNDRVEKVSVIITKQDTLSRWFSLPAKPNLDGSQDIFLTESLHFPKSANLIEVANNGESISKPVGVVFLMLGVILLFISFFGGTYILFPIPFLIIGSFFIFIGTRTEKINRHNAQVIQEWRVEALKYQQMWLAARRKSDYVYYCHRDDCVFIPNESGYSSSNEYIEFLFKGIS